MNLPHIPNTSDKTSDVSTTQPSKVPAPAILAHKTDAQNCTQLQREKRLRIAAIRRISEPTNLLTSARKCKYNPEVISYIPDQLDLIWKRAQTRPGLEGLFYRRELRKKIYFVFEQIYWSCRSPDFYRAISNREYLTEDEKLKIKFNGTLKRKSLLRKVIQIFPRRFIDPFHL